jgi:hypothetical protein
MATRHSADRRHNDSTRTPASWIPRAPRHRSSRVGRRAEMCHQPSRCLQKMETKRRWRHVRPGFSPIIDAPHAPEITAAKPSSLLPTHTADVTTITRGAKVRVDNAPRDRKSCNQAGFRASGWRDPDSNRGHHDFQSCALPTELSRQRARRLAPRLPLSRYLTKVRQCPMRWSSRSADALGPAPQLGRTAESWLQSSTRTARMTASRSGPVCPPWKSTSTQMPAATWCVPRRVPTCRC